MTHERVPQAFDIEDARNVGRELAQQRRQARRMFESCLTAAAEKKFAYRKALAIAFVSAEGDTAASREADAKQRASGAERDRDIAEGMVKVAQEKLHEVDGERATYHRLVEWSIALCPLAAEMGARRRGVS